MVQRLFQDPAGTIPAILPGQPVGLIKRLAGSVDASQATALSKGTLSRWPKSGRRNIADYSASPEGGQFWLNSGSTQSVTATKVGSGVEGGLPYVDYALNGVSTGVAFVALTQSAIGISAQDDMSSRLTARRIGGASVLGVNDGLRILVQRLDSSGTAFPSSAAQSAFIANETVDTTIQVSGVKGADPLVTALRSRVEVRLAAGITVDVIYRIKGFQSAPLANQTPLQLNYGPNDITEPGVADLWHLYNDGGDSLNVVLPAGTYGFATLNAATKAPQINSVVSDGTTPINVLRHERQADEILRAGAFNDTEIRAIQEYWGREFG